MLRSKKKINKSYLHTRSVLNLDGHLLPIDLNLSGIQITCTETGCLTPTSTICNLLQFIIFNRIVRGFTSVSLIVSDKAPRQESHHQRCKTKKQPFSMTKRRHIKKAPPPPQLSVLFVSLGFCFLCFFTCFPNSATTDYSHLDDPAEGRVFGRGTLCDRRHVVNKTHFSSVHHFDQQVRKKNRKQTLCSKVLAVSRS